MILPFAIFTSSVLSDDCECSSRCITWWREIKWCTVAEDSSCPDKQLFGSERWKTKWNISFCAFGKSKSNKISCGTGEAEQKDNKEDMDKGEVDSGNNEDQDKETDEPSTKAPTASAPVTQAPTTSAPVTEEQTTSAAVTEAPNKAKKATAGKAAALKAAAEKAAADKAAAEKAAVDKAAAEEMDKPSTEATTASAPVTEAPVIKAPTLQAPNDILDKEYLDVHNVLRCTVGQEPFKYDEKLGNGNGQKNAQDWADELAKTDGKLTDSGGKVLKEAPHSNIAMRDNQGENIGMGSSSQKNNPQSPTDMLMGMWEELPDWLLAKNGQTPNGQTGHFTQMAWEGKDQKFRCNRTNWPTERDGFYGSYQVCRYSPPGNYTGEEKQKVKDQCICPLSSCEKYVGSNHISKEIENFPTKISTYEGYRQSQTIRDMIAEVKERQEFWKEWISECKPENCLDSYKNYSK